MRIVVSGENSELSHADHERGCGRVRIVRKEDIAEPFRAPLGELIFEMIGRPEATGGTINHSLAHVVIRPGSSSPAHYHQASEETYYVLKGGAQVVIDDSEFTLHPGQACLIMPGESHQVFNHEEIDLELLAICAPAWTADDSFDA
jgi:mannose-6-phosphate isomerase-like protein (cupin superfamily)